MTKEDLVDLLRKILKTDAGLDFLSKLEPESLKRLGYERWPYFLDKQITLIYIFS